MAFNYSPKIVTNGLVLCLDAGNVKSYVSGSTTWNDLTSNQNIGTLTNGPTFNTGSGGSIVFDGSNDYINYGNNFNFEYNNLFTICGWFNFTNDQDSALISKQDDTSNYRGYILRKLSSYQLMIGLVNTPSNQIQVRSNTNVLTSGNWNYICGSYNGSILASGLKLYLNGNELSTTVVANSLGSNTILTSANFSIGKFGINSINNPLNGKNSITQIYNRSLSSLEITQNYNATKTRFGL